VSGKAGGRVHAVELSGGSNPYTAADSRDRTLAERC